MMKCPDNTVKMNMWVFLPECFQTESEIADDTLQASLRTQYTVATTGRLTDVAQKLMNSAEEEEEYKRQRNREKADLVQETRTEIIKQVGG